MREWQKRTPDLGPSSDSTSARDPSHPSHPSLPELLATLRAFAIPMRTKFRGITVRRGALIQGPAGWGEFSPFAEYGPAESARWLASAIESGTGPWRAPAPDVVPGDGTLAPA